MSEGIASQFAADFAEEYPAFVESIGQFPNLPSTQSDQDEAQTSPPNPQEFPHWSNDFTSTTTNFQYDGQRFELGGLLPFEQELTPTGTPTPPGMVAADQENIEPSPSVAPTPDFTPTVTGGEVVEAQETPIPANSVAEHIDKTVRSILECGKANEICAVAAFKLDLDVEIAEIDNSSGVIIDIVKTTNGVVLRLQCDRAGAVIHLNGGHERILNCEPPIQEIPLNRDELDEASKVVIDAMLSYGYWVDTGYDKYLAITTGPVASGEWELIDFWLNAVTLTPTPTLDIYNPCEEEILATVTPTPNTSQPEPTSTDLPPLAPTVVAVVTPDGRTVYLALVKNGKDNVECPTR